MLKDDHLIVCAIVSFVLLRNLLNNDVLSYSEKQTFHGYYFRHMLSSLVKGKKSIQGLFWDWLNTAQPTCPSGSTKQKLKAAEVI